MKQKIYKNYFDSIFNAADNQSLAHLNLPEGVNINETKLVKLNLDNSKDENLYTFPISAVNHLASKNDLAAINSLYEQGYAISLEDAAFGAGWQGHEHIIDELLKKAKNENERVAILSQAAKGSMIRNNKDLVKKLFKSGAKIEDICIGAGLRNPAGYDDFVSPQFGNEADITAAFYEGAIQKLAMLGVMDKEEDNIIKNLDNDTDEIAQNIEEQKAYFAALYSENSQSAIYHAGKDSCYLPQVFRALGVAGNIEMVNEIRRDQNTEKFSKHWQKEYADQFALGLLEGRHDHILFELFKDKSQTKKCGFFYQVKLNSTIQHLANQNSNHPLISEIRDKNLCEYRADIYTSAVDGNVDKLKHYFNPNMERANSIDATNVFNKLVLDGQYEAAIRLSEAALIKYESKNKMSFLKKVAEIVLKPDENNGCKHIQEHLQKMIHIAKTLNEFKKHTDELDQKYTQEINKKDFASTRDSLIAKKVIAGQKMLPELARHLLDLLELTSDINPMSSEDQEDTKSICSEIEKLFAKHKSVLGQHRGVSSYLLGRHEHAYRRLAAEIGLFILGLGVFYGFAALLNRGITGHYTFFYHETKSTTELNKVKASTKLFIPKKNNLMNLIRMVTMM